MYDATQCIGAFLDATAAKQPAPGGGSVTALAGALAAAIGEMVVNYSIGKKGLEGHQEELHKALDELHRARSLLLQLMIEDQQAFEALSAARKLPEGSSQSSEQFPIALLACIRVPQTIAASGAAILDLCDRLADRVNQYLLSDLAVCAELAMATVRCGIYNVRINLADLDDAGERQRFEQQSQQLLSRATALIKSVIPRIWKRVEAV